MEEKRRKEIAEKWNDFVREHEPFKLRRMLFNGDEEAMAAELEEYLGDADIMISQAFAGEKLGSTFKFIFPDYDERAWVVLDFLKVAQEFRLDPSRVRIMGSFENSAMVADFTAKVKPEKKDIELGIDKSLELENIRSIRISDEMVAVEVAGAKQPEYLRLSEYADEDTFGLPLALAKALEDFLYSDKASFSFTDAIAEWEESQDDDEEEEEDNMPAA